MKKILITLISVWALVIGFSGCGGGGENSSLSTESETPVVETSVDVNDDPVSGSSGSSTTNEGGLNTSFGTPPPVPGS